MALGQPVDYRLQQTDPLLSMMQGMRAGSAIQQVKEQELAKEQAAQSQQKLYELMNNPEATETDYRKFVALMPKEQQEGIMNVWNSMEEGKRQGMLDFTGSVMSALQGGQTETAIDLLKKRSEAEKNSGNTALAQNYEMMAKVAETNPDFAMSSMGMVLATVPNGDKILKNLSEAKALSGEDIESKYKMEMMEDKKINTRIRALEAKLRKETNDLKKEELWLKLNDLKEQHQQKKQARAAEADTAATTFDTTLNTVDQILNHPAFETATGWSSFVAAVPGTEAKDFSALVDTLKSKLFTMEVSKMKGMGALTEAEGRKLTDAIQNLDRSQTSGAFRKNVKEIRKYIEKGRSTIENKFADVERTSEEITPTTEAPAQPSRSYMRFAQ